MKKRIAVVGLGYVGLPLALEFAKKYVTIGFDIDSVRVNQIMKFEDQTLEIEKIQLQEVIVPNLKCAEERNYGLYCSNYMNDIESANFYIITVPTPTDKNNRPILKPLIKASNLVGKFIKKGDFVIYESTVYPGVTEEICIPCLEDKSKLVLNKDFFVGYSPERINPGDKERTLTKIKKITSGSTPMAAKIIDNLYKEIISAGTHLTKNIKIAEAAKVIENCQRDINIAFVNELSIIFNKLKIDTQLVLEAASTKWNFIPFKPGLVGGHCIGVDPYYLAHKAQELGYHPEIILSGRRLNDNMGRYIVTEIVKLMIKQNLPVSKSNILILGITFKENCPDIRNTRVIDIYEELKSYDSNIDVYDPWASQDEVKKEFGFKLIKKPIKKYHCLILAVAHKEFLQIDLQGLVLKTGVIYDIKGVLDLKLINARL